MIDPAKAAHVTTPTPPHTLPARQDSDALLRQAQAFETCFLAEMLGFAAATPGAGSFDGGAGEAQFASFLHTEQARLIVDRGGLGIAQTLFHALGGGDVSSGN